MEIASKIQECIKTSSKMKKRDSKMKECIGNCFKMKGWIRNIFQNEAMYWNLNQKEEM